MTPKAGARPGIQSGLLVGAIVVCLLLQAWLALVMEINWDEYFYLSNLYLYETGGLRKALQSFQVHLLSWVTSVPGDEIDQIEAGRLFMLGCFAGTCALVYALSRAFVSRIPALIAVLVFASAGFSVIHGASFRADPLTALLMMASLVLLARARAGAGSAAGAGFLAAVATMVTVKAVLYAPAFLGIAAWRLIRADDRRRTTLWLAGAALTAAAGLAILYAIQLGLTPKASNAASRAGLGNAAETQLAAGLLPRLREIVQFALLSPVQTILLLTGLGAAAAQLARRERCAEAFAVLGCGATLLCLLFYRNAFPYFFPFVLAPAAILAARAAEDVPALKKHAVPLAVALAAPAAVIANIWRTHDQRGQQQIATAVRSIFPRPVHYIDRNSMIAGYPKRGFFMSTWGMQNYRRTGVPVFGQVLALDTVPLVIANGPALQNAFGELPELPADYSLLDEDKAVLRRNYIHHWGPLWVGGKSLRSTPRGVRFQIAIPGTYTLAGADAFIDDRAIRAGQALALSRGAHVIKSAEDSLVTLRWGDRLPRPTQPFTGPIYRGF